MTKLRTWTAQLKLRPDTGLCDSDFFPKLQSLGLCGIHWTLALRPCSGRALKASSTRDPMDTLIPNPI